MNKQERGSLTAKDGFLNEKVICEKFSNWREDHEVKQWLHIMGYNPSRIEIINIKHIPTKIAKKRLLDFGILTENAEESIRFKKADIQIQVNISIDGITYTENISLKKTNCTSGYNQVDKRPVSTYKNIWHFDSKVEFWLKAFTGEILPCDVLPESKINNIKDKKKKRLFLTEIPKNELNNIINFFSNNKTLIVTDILKGRGCLSAEWMLVTKNKKNNTSEWALKDINSFCNFYGKGEVHVSPKGSLKIGKITMQRKGGTPDPTSLQFKINPLDIFSII